MGRKKKIDAHEKSEIEDAKEVTVEALNIPNVIYIEKLEIANLTLKLEDE